MLPLLVNYFFFWKKKILKSVQTLQTNLGSKNSVLKSFKQKMDIEVITPKLHLNFFCNENLFIKSTLQAMSFMLNAVSGSAFIQI